MVIQEYENNFLSKKYHSVTSFTQEHSNGCQQSETQFQLVTPVKKSNIIIRK